MCFWCLKFPNSVVMEVNPMFRSGLGHSMTYLFITVQYRTVFIVPTPGSCPPNLESEIVSGYTDDNIVSLFNFIINDLQIISAILLNSFF